MRRAGIGILMSLLTAAAADAQPPAERMDALEPLNGSVAALTCTLVQGRGRTVDAKIVGVAKEIDLALLKIDAAALPALPIAEDDALRQGELVFAFGSPEGLRNSVTWVS